jgi:hypothetical protein
VATLYNGAVQACWHVEVKVLREDDRHRWMRSAPMTLTDARRAHAQYKALGHASRIICDETQAQAAA